MLLFVDHHDSFSWNLIAQFKSAGQEVKVIQSTAVKPAEIGQLLAQADGVVFSPGPGHPRDYPQSIEIYRRAAGQLPIIGICLGFQLMLYAEGCAVNRLPEILHGQQTAIRLDSTAKAFAGIASPALVGRYHSLGVDPVSLPAGWQPTSWDMTTGRLLSFECNSRHLYGFQFHPDSFLTPEGDRILQNVLSACRGATVPSINAPIESTPSPNLWGRHGAFTTLRLSIAGCGSERLEKLYFPQAHLSRLLGDLQALETGVPEKNLLEEKLLQATRRQARELTAGEWLVRWSCSPPHWEVACRPCVAGQDSVSAELRTYLRRQAQQKSLDYQDLLDMLTTVERATTEIILCHPDGRLLEGITCNLLFFRDDVCHTPASDCLPGLSLKLLEPLLSKRYPLIRRDIALSEINSFDSILLCGSGRGVASVRSLAGYDWQEKSHKPLAFAKECLQQLFSHSHDVLTL